MKRNAITKNLIYFITTVKGDWPKTVAMPSTIPTQQGGTFLSELELSRKGEANNWVNKQIDHYGEEQNYLRNMFFY